MKNLKSAWLGLAAVVMLAGTGAVAGSKVSRLVTISSGASGYATGSLGSARASGDTTQNIGCTVGAGSDGSKVMNCYATSSAGTYASCTSNVPALIEAAQAVTHSSYIEFYWSGSQCTRLYVYHSSIYQPAQP